MDHLDDSTGNPLNDLKNRFPLLNQVAAQEPVFWANPHWIPFNTAKDQAVFTINQVEAARSRWHRFRPYLASAFPEIGFPEIGDRKGHIDSPLVEISRMKGVLERYFSRDIQGRILFKCDNLLPVSGSIKARGGIYEVLKHAEDLAQEAGLIQPSDDYSILSGPQAKQLFKTHTIAVGSTGNLGLSIGIMGAALGFKVVVHMSKEAKQWKKDLLRTKGVRVVEYASDYSMAVREGRLQALKDKQTYFIDDEQSIDLFMGYAAAGYDIADQLNAMQITIDKDHPLFVYLPCGVGGGPGGITYGLKQIFGDHVHCFFAEPTASPCMLLGLMTQWHDRICVRDLGLDNQTCADGLAVGRPSGLVGKNLNTMISGVFTVDDAMLYQLLTLVNDHAGLKLEPSAAAGAAGPAWLARPEAQKYLDHHSVSSTMDRAVHIIWATGGSMVPDDEFEVYTLKGKQ